MALRGARGIATAGPKYGMHSLRHAVASLFIKQGFTPKRERALMGHSTIQMTFDTYGHLFPSQTEDRVAMEQLPARLVGICNISLQFCHMTILMYSNH